MIVRKTWERRVSKGTSLSMSYTIYQYTGWFLFGFIPLFVDRKFVKQY